MKPLLALLFLGCLANSAVQAAEAAERVPMRAAGHGNFERIAFDWPRGVSYRVKREENQVTVEFAAAAVFNDTAVRNAKLQKLGGLAQSVDAQGSRYAFVVAPGAQVKDFRNGNNVVLDISGPAVGTVRAPAKLAAVAEAPATVSAPTASVPPPSAKKSEGAPAVGALSLAPVVASPAPPVAAVRSTPEIAVARTELLQNNPLPLAASGLTAPDAGQPPLAVLQINPGVPIALAAYERGGYAYLILERKLAPDMKQLLAGQNPQLQLQSLNLEHATGWRFVMPVGGDLRLDRSGSTWVVSIAGGKRELPIALSLIAEPHYALGARLFLPVTNPPDVVHLFDPVIGDELSVVPLLNPGDALTTPRRYADFTALPTAQGLVVAHRSDRLAVRKVANGVEISAEGGLRLSSPEDTGMIARSDAARGSNRAMLFDFRTWHGLPDESFTQTRQRLLQNIVDVPAVERDRARIELARFYFAHGFAAEALALLNYMQERLPDLFVRPEFRALHGAAQILANNPTAGLQDFATPGLNDVVDRPLWEALAQAQLRDYTAAAPKFDATIGFIEDFPEPIFVRFATMALETLVATGQEAKADQWLDNWQASKKHQDFLDSPAAHYIHGVVHYSLNNPEQAAKHWRIAAASNDRLYRTRAEIALVDYDLGKGTLTPASAAQRLEGLRFAWRGDALEWETLRRLGLYYLQAKKYRDGFVNLERARKLYPEMAGNAVIAQKLSDTFHDLYTTNLGAGMTPLEALSLYQDYRYLVTDPAVARPVMRSLTERLVAIDLLEQASQLLQDLMTTATGEERAQLGARLAGISLLDRQPAKALAALDASQSEGLKVELLQERQLLRARALLEQGQLDAVKSLLAGRGDAAAQLLLADMAWRQAQWGEAAAAFRRALGDAPKDGVLSNDQAQLVVRIATALALGGDQAGLQQFAKDFDPAMRQTKPYPVFKLLTEAQDSRSLREIAAQMGKSNDNDVFRKFLDQYRSMPVVSKAPAKGDAEKKGLSEKKPEAEKKAEPVKKP